MQHIDCTTPHHPICPPPTTTHVRTTTGYARTQTFKHPSGTGTQRNASYIEDRRTIQAKQDRALALSPWVSRGAQLSSTSTCGPGFAFWKEGKGETDKTNRQSWTVSAAELSPVHTTSFLQRPSKNVFATPYERRLQVLQCLLRPPCEPGIP